MHRQLYRLLLSTVSLLCFGHPLLAQQQFCNSTSIAIPGSSTTGPASPYPSSINVSGLTGLVTKVTVKLDGLSHRVPDDIDILLVSPTGQNLIILSDVGGGNEASNLVLTLDDEAPTALPDGGVLTSGTFRPTNAGGTNDNFPSPAPAPSGGSTLAVFTGTNPNGTWSLYIMDDALARCRQSF